MSSCQIERRSARRVSGSVRADADPPGRRQGGETSFGSDISLPRFWTSRRGSPSGHESGGAVERAAFMTGQVRTMPRALAHARYKAGIVQSPRHQQNLARKHESLHLDKSRRSLGEPPRAKPLTAGARRPLLVHSLSSRRKRAIGCGPSPRPCEAAPARPPPSTPVPSGSAECSRSHRESWRR